MCPWPFHKKIPIDELKRVDALIDQGKLDEALSTGQALAEQHPGPDMCRKLADISRQMGRPDLEIEYLRGVIAASRSIDRSDHLRMANVLTRTGDFVGAKALVEKILARHADDLDAQIALARINRLAGQIDMAVLILERLLARNRDNIDARKERALCRVASKSYEHARTDLVPMLGRFQDDSDFIESLGLCCYLTGRYREAKPCYKRAVKLDPAGARNRLMLGLTRAKLNENRRAYKLLDQALQELGDSEEPLETLCACAMRLDRFDDAYKYFVRLRAIRGEGAQEWRDFAAELLEKGARALAAEAYRHVRYLDPADLTSVCKWLELSLETDKRDDALRTLRSLVDAHDDEIEPRVLLARALIDDGQFGEARDLIEDAAVLDAGGPGVVQVRERLEKATSDDRA